MVRSPACNFNHFARKSLKQPPLNSQLKSPKCYIKITGSRYNGTFLLNIDNGLDDVIYRTMRDIEAELEAQADPMMNPRVSPKNCLSSVFRCFSTNELQAKAVCSKKDPQKPQKSVDKPVERALTETINKSNMSHPISGLQPECSSERVMREVMDVFQTTLDEFRRENKSPSEAEPSILSTGLTRPTLSTPPDTIKTAAVDKTDVLNEEKVSFIKFTQEEVLVIQPPKPSSTDTKHLEVGIQVKPKSTASNVGQSIKLAKDKVLIGVQDGRGVLQINEGVPKRSLQMIIEEGIDGKPSMKLSLKEGEPDQNDHPKPLGMDCSTAVERQGNENQYPKTYSSEKNNAIQTASTMTNGDTITKDNLSLHANVRHYKSTESQVTWTCLEGMNEQANDVRKCKSESSQHTIPPPTLYPKHCGCCTVERSEPDTAYANAINECSDVSQDTALNAPYFNRYCDLRKSIDSRFNRMPYLVHTLHDPRSPQSSSAYFSLENPSVHFSKGHPLNSKKFSMSRRQTKKPKSFCFSSDCSTSSKCTKIFRDIEDIGGAKEQVRSLKGVSVKPSRTEDLEKILKNMCGSSYICHQPKQRESEPRETKHEDVVHSYPNIPSASLLFDQWTQTDGCTQKEPDWVLTKSRAPKNKMPRVRGFGDGSRLGILRKKARRVKNSASKRAELSSVSTSCREDVLSSDSSESNRHLVFSMLTASNDNPSAKTSSGLVGKNWFAGEAKSLIGQKIFAAIGDRTKQAGLSSVVEKSDSFMFPACREKSRLIHGGNTVSVVNLALYEPYVPQMTKITEENIADVEGFSGAIGSEADANKNGPAAEESNPASAMADVQAINVPVTTPPCSGMMEALELRGERNPDSAHQAHTVDTFIPIRVKSKSCQNLGLTPSRSVANIGNRMARSPAKKLRHPHLTATDSTSIMNVCGILNLSEGGMKAGGHTSVCTENPNPALNNDLPSAVRSLLMPKQLPVELNDHERICTYPYDSFGTTNTAESLLVGPSCAPYEAYDSVIHVVTRRSLFERSFFASMKTVRRAVNKKFCSLFRKRSVHTNAIPLQKKSGNLQLYPRAH